MTTSATLNLGRRIENCVQCGAALPLCEPLMPSDSRTWLCSHCGREYKGQLPENFCVDELRNLRPEPVIFDRSQLEPPSEELLAAVRKLQPIPDNDFRDKRRSSRHPVMMLVPAQPFDAVLNPIDHPCILIARNISTGGICLLHDRSLRAEFLALELSAPGGDLIQVLVQVLRSRPRGGIYEIGGEFIARIANTTTRVLR